VPYFVVAFKPQAPITILAAILAMLTIGMSRIQIFCDGGKTLTPSGDFCLAASSIFFCHMQTMMFAAYFAITGTTVVQGADNGPGILTPTFAATRTILGPGNHGILQIIGGML
jgi:hypothetical protein